MKVSSKGIHRVPFALLPDDFTKSSENLQLWHRGKEISILSTANNEVLFYAEPNDGAIDSLLFRPTTARLNPYISFFSDLSSYFLTVNTGTNKRAVLIGNSPLTGEVEPFHFQKLIKTYTTQFAQSTSAIAAPMNNSFYEDMNSWTGSTIYGQSASGTTSSNSVFTETFKLKNWISSADKKPQFEFMVNGLHNGAHNVQISIGKTLDNASLRNISTVNFVGFGGRKVSKIELGATDISSDGNGGIKVISNSSDANDRFALSYYSIIYPQKTDMSGDSSAYFYFKGTGSSSSRVKITGVPGDSRIYDVTNVDQPKILTYNITDSSVEGMIPRTANNDLTLFISSSSKIKTISNDNISTVDFTPAYTSDSNFNKQKAIDPGKFDYLIITNKNLLESAKKYAQYRNSLEGGNYTSVVFEISSIYDQFNYGEPSAVAVRRFVDYMLKTGIRAKHNLFLIGKSITLPDRIVKEMPGEVPTFGDPGSDVLLVAGLQGKGENVPSIPVGRISALQPIDVLNYLAKVQSYEKQIVNIGWRKNVLHVSGGKTASEINQLRDILNDLVPEVSSGEVGGKVIPYVKQSTIEVEEANVFPDVNKGVGMISYFGHGSPTVTDLDLGFVSDASRGYSNQDKYPLMYFNGCGVGNVFSRRDENVLATDWLVTPNKGAIAIIANSFNSYVAPTTTHLIHLYDEIFGQTHETPPTIGQIMQAVASKISSQSSNIYDIGNLHQSLVHGDPAIQIIKLKDLDYSVDSGGGILLYSESAGKNIGNSQSLRVATILSNLGKYDKTITIPLQVKIFYSDGTIDIKNLIVPSIAYQDTVFVSLTNNKSIQSIKVDIDPGETLKESNISNNTAELLIDWNVAKEETVYPRGLQKDLIAPLLTVTFNNRILKNDEVIKPSPKIQLLLIDDRAIDVDSSYMNVYLKSCGDNSCNFKRLAYSNGKLRTSQVSNKSLMIDYFADNLVDGVYELMVEAKDSSGNSTLQPYTIRFSIDKENVELPVVVSPNPASSFVHFEVNIDDAKSFKSIEWLIYDSQGNILEKNQIDSLFSGLNEWYWKPNSASGLYFYNVKFINLDGKESRNTGKIVIVK
ncbi:C25 family cysteine peptidase [Dyadobacter sp. CY356]|nr:C25 family cysteine peptidase [Dyadobacter sp. CY356]